MAFHKVRIRFRKSGDLRLVSHLDLMRSFERMPPRAPLPSRLTEGFPPTPRLVLAQSLPLGLVGHAEVAELELVEDVDPAEVLSRLREQAPPGIEFLSAKAISLKTIGRPRRAAYRIAVANPPPELPNRISEFLAATAVWADRERPRPRQVNIRPYVERLTTADKALDIITWLPQHRTTPPDQP